MVQPFSIRRERCPCCNHTEEGHDLAVRFSGGPSPRKGMETHKLNHVGSVAFPCRGMENGEFPLSASTKSGVPLKKLRSP